VFVVVIRTALAVLSERGHGVLIERREVMEPDEFGLVIVCVVAALLLMFGVI
jgi:hypothetical protein